MFEFFIATAYGAGTSVPGGSGLEGLRLFTPFVLPVWAVFFFWQKDIPLLIISLLFLLVNVDVLSDIPGFVGIILSFGSSYQHSSPIFVILGVAAGVLGVIRSVNGLSGTIFKSDSVVDSWNYIVKGGVGRGDSIIGTIESAVIDCRMPNVATRKEGVAMELFGEKRPFLVIQNMKYKEFKMYIYARDFGTDLDVSWYFVAEPRFLKRTMSKYATGNPQDMTMRVSIFAQQDIHAFKDITHDRVKQTLDALCEELKLDPTGLNTGSRGFLAVW